MRSCQLVLSARLRSNDQCEHSASELLTDGNIAEEYFCGKYMVSTVHIVTASVFVIFLKTAHAHCTLSLIKVQCTFIS
jgi:hypothetical protein